MRRIEDTQTANNFWLGSSYMIGNAESGEINVINNGDFITTRNDYSKAFVVQTIGGGGGWVAGNQTKDAYSYLGADRFQGELKAGDIELENTADIYTAGQGSDALLVQSIGGGGGVIGRQAGLLSMGVFFGTGDTSSGSITLSNTGSITTQGNQSPGITAQSIGGGGGRANDASGDFYMGVNTYPPTAEMLETINPILESSSVRSLPRRC